MAVKGAAAAAARGLFAAPPQVGGGAATPQHTGAAVPTGDSTAAPTDSSTAAPVEPIAATPSLGSDATPSPAPERRGKATPQHRNTAALQVESPSEAVSAVVQHKPPHSITFRYGQREVDWMEEVIFEVRRSHGVKLSKQDIVRLGVQLTLQNYKKAGSDSALGLLIRRRGMQTDE
jgi:hypothetical protein